jgi:hypothetical protein
MMFTRLSLLSLIFAAAINLPPAFAQVRDVPSKECARYAIAVKGDVLSRELLKDWEVALRCLIEVIDGAKTTVTSVQAAQSRTDVLQASRAIRAILDDIKTPAIDKYRKDIRGFGEHSNVQITSVLVYGARSDNYDLRLNSTLILGNTIDNDTVCVPLAHLYAKDLNVSGRANLLAIVTVVASSANKENVANLKTLVQEFRKLALKDLPDTSRIIDSLEAKINAREPEAQPGTASELASCRWYEPIAGKEWIRYP